MLTSCLASAEILRFESRKRERWPVEQLPHIKKQGKMESRAYAIPKVRDICTFSVQFNFLVSQPCFPAHVFMKGTLCSVVRRNF